ncbi:hypothetical protein IWW36_000022 [Coemansia brasiliensis]|uniref:N-acetyltransferase domain-containing protein n=1 Tax=Coemansia brasiliensis TaxID=2650707 RepID=A0A9W8IBS7_9FUNG|nr:hypothetical protein IWW36_000022 [Coemansia brasiliensis]
MTDKKLSHKVKAPVKRAAASSRRQSTRLAAKPKSTAPTSDTSNKEIENPAPLQELAGGFMQRLDAISRKLSQLALHKPEEAIDIATSKHKGKPAAAEASSSVDSGKTLVPRYYPTVDSKEKEMCRKLFSPLSAVPSWKTLQSVLIENPMVRIPIHRHTYDWLQTHVEDAVLKDIFDIVEEVGNICPKLTPRVEAALHVNVPSNVTEGMQQCALDTFLMGIIGTAQEYVTIYTKVDRNANELSMTKNMCRPDYLLMLNGQLVFKGEEKKSGDVRNIALELTEKMIPGSVGKDGKLDFLLGYATAGSNILFECIYGDDQMSECSEILNIERVADRVTLIVILVNVMRVARSLYNSRHVPQLAGIDGSLITLIPPDKDQDTAMSRLLSDIETMKYLKFMTRTGGFTKKDAAARRVNRDERQQQKKELVNYTVAIKRSRIPQGILQNIGDDEFLPAREIPIDGGSINMNESYVVIGCCGLNNIDLSNRCSEAGIILDARFWRSGASSEALYLTLKFGFETLCLHRIALQTTEENLGMRGWMERVVGVDVECIRKEVLYLGNDEYIDSWDYAIFDHQWYVSVENNLQSRIVSRNKH